MVIAAAHFTSSFKKSIENWIKQTANFDLLVTSASKLMSTQSVPMPVTLGSKIWEIKGVEDVIYIRTMRDEFRGNEILVSSYNMEEYRRHGAIPFREGDPEAGMKEASNGLNTLISENFSSKYDLHLGDSFVMNTPSGQQTFSVRGVVVDYTSDIGQMFVNRETLLKYWKDTRVDSYGLYLAKGASLENVRREILKNHGREHSLYVLSNSEFRAEVIKIVDDAFMVVYSLQILAMIISFIGIINTLLVSILDRIREIGIMRAVGTLRSQVGKIVIYEAALLGLISSALGCVGGISVGTLVIYVLNVQMTGWHLENHLPVQAIIFMLLSCMAISAISGFYPSRKASSLNVVEALHFE
jgi:putative ABC transport system permease protein